MKSMRNLILASLLLGGMFTFTACDNEPSAKDISRVTYFPSFEYEGGDFSIVPCGTDFTLAPVKATENGVELPVTTDIDGAFFGSTAFDVNSADKYVITSSATNADGFDGLVTRTVMVACTGDLINSLEGLYSATVVRNGVMSAQYQNLKYVIIKKVGPNQYQLSDAIGGYYAIGRAYGDAYNASGLVITANNIPANDFSFSGPVGVGAFGGSLTMSDFDVNPENGTITFTSVWDAGFTFVVTLTQVPL